MSTATDFSTSSTPTKLTTSGRSAVAAAPAPAGRRRDTIQLTLPAGDRGWYFGHDGDARADRGRAPPGNPGRGRRGGRPPQPRRGRTVGAQDPLRGRGRPPGGPPIRISSE